MAEDESTTGNVAEGDESTEPQPVDVEVEETVLLDSMSATFSAIASADADEIRATGSAIGSAHTGSLVSMASAIGLANIEGDAQISVSAVPILRTAGGATFSQAYASAVIVGGDMQIHQSAAPVIIGKELDATQVLSCVAVTGEAKVTRSTIGLLLSRNAEVSDDSRILVSNRAAMIIAAALLGGFGLVAIAMLMGAERVAQWRPNMQLPTLPWKRG